MIHVPHQPGPSGYESQFNANLLKRLVAEKRNSSKYYLIGKYLGTWVSFVVVKYRNNSSYPSRPLLPFIELKEKLNRIAVMCQLERNHGDSIKKEISKERKRDNDYSLALQLRLCNVFEHSRYHFGPPTVALQPREVLGDLRIKDHGGKQIRIACDRKKREYIWC